MTKSEFFKMLNDYIANHNEYAQLDGQDKYTAEQIEPYIFHEDPCQLANYRIQDPKYPWTEHATGFVLAECWYIELKHHKTAEAAEKQHKIFTRWIAEYKASNN